MLHTIVFKVINVFKNRLIHLGNTKYNAIKIMVWIEVCLWPLEEGDQVISQWALFVHVSCKTSKGTYIIL